MISKRVFLFTVSVLIATTAFAQKELSPSEIQDFTKLIKNNKQYKDLKASVDSFNKAQKMDLQEIKVTMVTKESGGASDDIVFSANVKKVYMGFTTQTLHFEYDRKKKQLVTDK